MTEDYKGFATEDPFNLGIQLLELATEKLGSRLAVELVANADSNCTFFTVSRVDASIAQRLGAKRVGVIKKETLILDDGVMSRETTYFFKPQGVVCAFRGASAWEVTDLDKSRLLTALSDAQIINPKANRKS